MLAAGPLTPRELWAKLGVEPIVGRRAVQPLIASGAVRAEGATMSRRFTLGAKASRPSAAPAKEDL